MVDIARYPRHQTRNFLFVGPDSFERVGVKVQDHAVIPRMLSLAILYTGRTFDAVRRWRRGQSIGLEFSVEEGRRTSPQLSASDRGGPEL